MGAKGLSQHYIGSKGTRGPEADGDEDAEGEDDVEFDDASGAGYLDADAEGEEDDEHDEYLQSGDGSDASEGGEEGQEIDGMSVAERVIYHLPVFEHTEPTNPQMNMLEGEVKGYTRTSCKILRFFATGRRGYVLRRRQ